MVEHGRIIISYVMHSSGKTTLCNQLALGEGGSASPTVGLNVRVMTKNRVTFKMWDIGKTCPDLELCLIQCRKFVLVL